MPSTSKSLGEIFALPLSNILSDSEYGIDVFTASSLGSEFIQGVQLNVTAKNIHGWTAVMYSAYLGHGDVCQILLRNGSDPEASNDKGQTPIMLASSCGSSEAVNALIKSSAKVNQKDKYGRTCLHYAIKYNQVVIVDILLQNGSDPNLADFEGMTSMLVGCEVGNEQIVSALLKNKGDPTRKNVKGKDGFQLAADHPKVLTVLKNREIISILSQLELDKYSNKFSEKGIYTMEAFLSLTEKDLDEMGVTLFGPRRKILHFIKQNKTNISNDHEVPRKEVSDRPIKQESNSVEFVAEFAKNNEPAEVHRSKGEPTLQSEELKKQRDLNSRICKILSEMINRNCETCLEFANQKEIRELVKSIDEMNIRIDIALST